MESVNGTLKVECVHEQHFTTRDEARRAIVEYIGYYNTQRRHSALGNVSPAEFERCWRAEQARTCEHRVTQKRPVPVRRTRPDRPSVDDDRARGVR